jgi:hypothetical protein
MTHDTETLEAIDALDQEQRLVEGRVNKDLRNAADRLGMFDELVEALESELDGVDSGIIRAANWATLDKAKALQK